MFPMGAVGAFQTPIAGGERSEAIPGIGFSRLARWKRLGQLPSLKCRHFVLQAIHRGQRNAHRDLCDIAMYRNERIRALAKLLIQVVGHTLCEE